MPSPQHNYPPCQGQGNPGAGSLHNGHCFCAYRESNMSAKCCYCMLSREYLVNQYAHEQSIRQARTNQSLFETYYLNSLASTGTIQYDGAQIQQNIQWVQANPSEGTIGSITRATNPFWQSSQPIGSGSAPIFEAISGEEISPYPIEPVYVADDDGGDEIKD